LIKVKFNEFKEKAQKQEMTGELEEMTGSQAVGMVGHVVIFYRQHEDAEKRKIVLPDREA
jgi:RNA-binding protein